MNAPLTPTQAHLMRLPPAVLACFQAVEREYAVTAKELLSRERGHRVSKARHGLYAAIRGITWPNGKPRYSLPNIARFCLRMDHTTVLSGLRRHAERMGEGG